MLQALIDKRIGRRDQAQAWVWRLAEYTRELHEEYAVQRWPETKRLLGLLVNSSGRAHGRNARRLVHAARKQDRRLAVGLLAAAVSHTPEGEEVLRGARMRMARKPSAVARELLRNFPKGGKRRRKRKRGGNGDNGRAPEVEATEASTNGGSEEKPKRRSRRRKGKEPEASANGAAPENVSEPEAPAVEEEAPKEPAKAKAAKPIKAKAKATKKAAPKATKKPAAKKAKAKAKAVAKKAPKAKAAKPKAAAKAKAKRKPKAAKAGSEAGQMNIPGTEGDPVAVGESDE
jgi:hypothetical protein